jgi:putative protease
LLAPAGQVESFLAAVENGADAVYLGLKQLSARASAANFSLEELAALLPFAHKRKILVYVALNSILTAPDIPQSLDLLQSLSDLNVDALIVQDPGIFFLTRRFFPSLKLHASTLMTIHNHAGVNQLERMGAGRVVLARELNLEEIKDIARHSKAELEIFVHGALCYSYSGLCLASSFRGGHSGLQGRCVQPCRLRFRQGREEGFFLSCNDLCALPLIPELKKLRISALKIEGRMKSADYIARVVRAYRLMLDAPRENENEALSQARELLAHSPSRRLTAGYFEDDSKRKILSPHRSGSSGQWVGTVRCAQSNGILVSLRHKIWPGDRLRPESSKGEEQQAFTVSEIRSEAGKPMDFGPAGENILLAPQLDLHQSDRLIRVGVKDKPTGGGWQRIRKEIPEGKPFRRKFLWREGDQLMAPFLDSGMSKENETLMVKVAQAEDLVEAFESSARWVLLTATRHNLERLAKQRLSSSQKRRFAWSLPPLIPEKDDRYYRLGVHWFCHRDFQVWELNSWGHFDLFEKCKNVNLIGGYRLNIRNNAAMAELAHAGCRRSVLSLEITREELQQLGQGPFSRMAVVTLFSWPPLFTSRLIPQLEANKPFRTPRNETYYYEKKGGNAFIYADQPVNWLDHLPALRDYGFRCFLLDLSEGPAKQVPNIQRVIQNFRTCRTDKPSSLFNLDRRPR